MDTESAAAVFPEIEVVCQTEPGRLNEDAWVAMQTGPLDERIVIAAIDGATTRMTPPPLQHHLDAQPIALTPAAYAARVIRDSLVRQVAAGPTPEPRAMLLEANADLASILIDVFGELTLEGLYFPEEVYAALAHDPRLVRLGLPASVAALAEYDPSSNRLRFARVGDAQILIAYRDGRFEIPVQTPDADIDSSVLRTALGLRDLHPDKSFRQLVDEPEVRRMDLYNALFQNYVDEHGLPQPSQGTGAINGLPELRYFVKSGEILLTDVLFVCVFTDGLEWPASTHEIVAEEPEQAAELTAQRRQLMVQRMDEHGLGGYAQLVWAAKTEDPDFELYPRFKLHDDATGVLLRFCDLA